jgi:ferrochelatase
MKFTIVPALYNKPDYLQNLADSTRRRLNDMIIFCFLTTEFRHIRKTDITKSHCKIDGSCCNNRRRHMSFATVISVTKRQSKLSNY